MTRARRALCLQLSLGLLWMAASVLGMASVGARTAHAELPKKETRDYDGRPDPTTAGDVLLWVPRVVLSPLYLVSEYVVRRPLGFLVTAAEQSNLPEVIYDFLTFGEDHSVGIVPVAFLDFGFNPSVGLFFFWNDAGVRGQDLQLTLSTWGEDWLAAKLTDRLELSNDTALVFHAAGIRRPDYAYYGTGPRTTEADRSRYGASRIDVGGAYEQRFWRASSFSASGGVRSVSFHHGYYDEDPDLQQQVAAGVFGLPDGFSTGYTLIYDKLFLAIDSRRPRPAPGSGVRLEASAEQDSDVRRSPGSGFMRYGANLGGFYDLGDNGRVVSLTLTTLFTDPLGKQPVPFTELAEVGGAESMRGFLPGRMYGRSSAVATLHYRWPIWIWLDGSIQIAVGNVFDEHLRDFSPRLLRLSAAIGIESVGSPDSSLELLVGMGSETFEHGTQITSARIAVGSNHGF